MSIITIAAGILVAVAVVSLVIFIIHVISTRRDNRPQPFTRPDALSVAKGEIYNHEQKYHGMHGGICDSDAEDMRRQLEASKK
ncbi:MAG: hypothetical protein ABII82_04335 [Verrucomicrobiota bacterium]